MKKIVSLLFLSIIVLTSCEGPQGPPGFDGLDGRDGAPGPQGPAGDVAAVFEIDQVNFISDNNVDAAVNVVIPEEIEVFESDVVLVYVIDPIASTEVGADVWEPLPRTFLFNEGGFAQFRFNFIFDDALNIFDLDIILQSDDFGSLDSSFTQNQIFRIVVVPGAFIKSNANTLLSMDALLKKYQIKTEDIKKVSLH